MNFETLLQRLTEFIQKEAKTETVIGEAFKLGEFTCVPVVRVGMGFGSGGGEGDSAKTGKGHGGGAGAGIGIDPIGFLVTKGNEISFISTHRNSALSEVFEKVPDLIKKFVSKKEAAHTWAVLNHSAFASLGRYYDYCSRVWITFTEDMTSSNQKNSEAHPVIMNRYQRK